MKIKEFMKDVAAPIISVIFLMALFRPLCTAEGECNYLLMWFLIGIAVGIRHMYLWIIPKGYDLGGTMGILCVNLLIAGVIGGVILTGRLLKASMYLTEAMAAGITWMMKIVCKGIKI